MNSTNFLKETLICFVTDQNNTDKTYLIISICLLSVIGVSGFAGNTLVLLVYCRRPQTTCCWCPKSSREQGKRLQHSQRRLLISLAVIDLLTTILVLPFDIGHKAFTLFNIRLYCDRKFDNFAYGWIDNLRNIMFAIEGSILMAIAIDRFVLLGSPYIKQMSGKMKNWASGDGELQYSPTGSVDASTNTINHPIASELHSPTSKSFPNSSSIDDGVELQRQPDGPALVNITSIIRRRICVILLIAFTGIITTALESAVFILQFKENNHNDYSLPAARLRHFLNRFYLVCTLITFPVVCGTYICIFLAIRKFDKMRARLKNGSRSNPRPRSRRTALTLFIATLIFYLTLLPVLVVHFGNWSNDSGSEEDMERDVHTHPSSAYIHHEFYYINNAANFFIYSWVSPIFRRRIRELYKRPN